ERHTAEAFRAETSAVRDQAAAAAAAHTAETDRLREQLREENHRATAATIEAAVTAARLEAAQAAAELVLPDPIDLSRDLGDGVIGVVLPEAAIGSVTREPDGAIVLYHQGHEIRLGGPERAPAHGRALAAAILAVSSPRPDR
ncbi:hypothetical protein AB0J43_16660, partial [Nonomuraea fuscirosea]